MPGRPRYNDILTPREWQVLDLLRQGLTNDQIAERLSISHDGAKYHVSEIITKLGVSNRREAAAWRPTARVHAKLPALAFLARGISGALGRLATPFVFGITACSLVVLAAGILTMALRSDAASGDDVGLGKVVYVDGGDLWTKQLPDGPPQRLSSDGDNFAPQWSPSGDWLLYQKPVSMAGPETWLMRTDGSDNHQLPDASQTRWAPREDTLAYVSSDDKIYLEGADGSNQRLLVDAEAVGQAIDWYIEWSPDGGWLAVTTSKRGFGFPAEYVGLWAVRTDGTDSRELVGVHQAENGLVVAGWTPDSRWVIYSRDPAFSASYVADGLQWQAAPVDSTDGPPRGVFKPDIANQFDRGQTVLRYDDYVDFSPDGSSIAAVRGGGRDAFMNKTIAVVDTSSGFTSRDITSAEVGAGSPAWSPDGSTIAYTEQPPTGVGRPDDVVNRRVWLMDSDGSNKRRLTSDETGEDTPQWSRDGRYVLYVLPTVTPVKVGGPNDPSRATVVLRRLSDGSTQQVLELPFYVNDIQRNIGYYGHFDWDKVFDWWQGAR